MKARPELRWALLAAGALLLLTSPLTWLFTARSGPWAAAKATAGVAALALAFVLRGRDETSRPGRKGRRFSPAVAGVLLALAGVNALVQWKDPDTDLTAAQLHTLAPQTQAALSALSAPVHVTAWVAPEHPSTRELEALLSDCVRAGKGRFSYERIDPRQRPDAAARSGLREGEQAVVVERTGDRPARATLSAVSEEELTRTLLELERTRTTRVYFLAGHGEALPPLEGAPASPRAPLNRLADSLQGEGYVLAALDLAAAREVPRDADVLVLAGPETPRGTNELQALRRYVNEGGRLALLVEPNVSTGLEPLLAELGLELDLGVVADAASNVETPYVPLATELAEHPITRVLRAGKLGLQLPTARGLTVLRSGPAADVSTRPLVFTSADAWEESDASAAPAPSSGEKTGRLTLAVAGTRAVPGGSRSHEARWWVVGEADLLRDVLWLVEPNRNFVLNALAWLSGRDEDVTLRPRLRAGSGLALSSSSLARLRLFGGELLPLLLGGWAIALSALRRSR